MGDIVEVIGSTGSCETLMAALHTTGLVATLRGAGPFTVFAPADEAFDLLPSGTLDLLLDDPPQLAALLRAHIIAAQLLTGGNLWMGAQVSLGGQQLVLHSDGGQLLVDVAVLVRPNLVADNGVVHLIDRVLLPV